MGWKSTIYITREHAKALIRERLDSISDEDLGRAVEAMGFGDNSDLAHYGHNFIVSDYRAREENEMAEYE